MIGTSKVKVYIEAQDRQGSRALEARLGGGGVTPREN